MTYVSTEAKASCMSLIGIISAILTVLIINVVPSTMPVELNGQVHLLYFLMSLFAGLVVYQVFSE
jgi:hypothetical protein